MLIFISVVLGVLGRAPQPQMIAIRPLSSARSLLGDLFSPGATVEGPDDQDYARVHEYMTPASQVVSLSPKMRLDDAACRLCEAGVSGAPVVGPCGITGERRLLGVLSQKDLLYSAAGRGRMRFLTSGPRSQRHVINTQRMRKILEGDVGSVMSAQVATIGPDDTVREAAKLLLDRGISRVPVVDREGGLVGLLSASDIMRTVTKAEIGCSVFG